MANPDSRVTIHMAASLDGFIARKDGSVDWLETSDEFEGGDAMDPEFVEGFKQRIPYYGLRAAVRFDPTPAFSLTSGNPGAAYVVFGGNSGSVDLANLGTKGFTGAAHILEGPQGMAAGMSSDARGVEDETLQASLDRSGGMERLSLRSRSVPSPSGNCRSSSSRSTRWAHR